MNPLLFFSAFFGVFILINMYISKRLIRRVDISDKAKLYARAFLILNLIGIALYMLSRYYIEVPGRLYFLFSLPIGILFLLFVTTLIYDASMAVLSITPINAQRRLFFKRTLDISSGTAAAALSLKAIYNVKQIEIQSVHVDIKNLKRSYIVAQLSDLHIGGAIDADFIKDIVQKTNALNADITVITGDLIDVEVSHAADALQELSKLSSRLGTYYIVGNHEYFHGAEAIMDKVESFGIKVLKNESVYIGDNDEGFNLAGVFDMLGYRTKTLIPDLQNALKNTKNGSPTVLLAHQPLFVKEIKEGVDLMLCGHTHGGQIYPFRFLVGLQQPYINGLHKHDRDLQIYVNKGTGFWGPPMRLGAGAEITKLTLTPLSAT